MLQDPIAFTPSGPAQTCAQPSGTIVARQHKDRYFWAYPKQHHSTPRFLAAGETLCLKDHAGQVIWCADSDHKDGDPNWDQYILTPESYATGPLIYKGPFVAESNQAIAGFTESLEFMLAVLWVIGFGGLLLLTFAGLDAGNITGLPAVAFTVLCFGLIGFVAATTSPIASIIARVHTPERLAKYAWIGQRAYTLTPPAFLVKDITAHPGNADTTLVHGSDAWDKTYTPKAPKILPPNATITIPAQSMVTLARHTGKGEESWHHVFVPNATTLTGPMVYDAIVPHAAALHLKKRRADPLARPTALMQGMLIPSLIFGFFLTLVISFTLAWIYHGPDVPFQHVPFQLETFIITEIIVLTIAAIVMSLVCEKLIDTTPNKLCNPRARLHEDHVFVPPRSIYAQMEAHAKASVDTNAR